MDYSSESGVEKPARETAKQLRCFGVLGSTGRTEQWKSFRLDPGHPLFDNLTALVRRLPSVPNEREIWDRLPGDLRSGLFDLFGRTRAQSPPGGDIYSATYFINACSRRVAQLLEDAYPAAELISPPADNPADVPRNLSEGQKRPPRIKPEVIDRVRRIIKDSPGITRDGLLTRYRAEFGPAPRPEMLRKILLNLKADGLRVPIRD